MHVAYRYQHVTISLYYLHAKISAFNSVMQQNPGYRNITWTFADCCYVCYATKTNSRTISSRLSQPASTGKGGDM